jgi:hypothetical protein
LLVLLSPFGLHNILTFLLQSKPLQCIILGQ